jgi:two-component system cell cycle sensor histidine kinase/response regulator CckA
MVGKECLRELLKIAPEAKVIIASGCAGDATTSECVGMGAKGFVGKPFQIGELLREVRRTLDQR